MIEVPYFAPAVIGFFVADRALARWFTGSWWGQPSDLTYVADVGGESE